MPLCGFRRFLILCFQRKKKEKTFIIILKELIYVFLLDLECMSSFSLSYIPPLYSFIVIPISL